MMKSRSSWTRIAVLIMSSVALSFALGFSELAFAAKVKKVIKAKKRVLIDMGKDDGITKGTRICFFKKNKKRKAACGKVIKAWGNKAYVKVKSVAKVKKGMQAAISKKGKKTKRGKKKMMAKAENASLIKVNYIMSLATASAYNNLSYVYSKDGPYSSLWEPVTAANAALLGFGADYEMPLGADTLALGVKYKLYTSAQGKAGSFITSDFGDNANRFILVSQEASSIGAFADYMYLNFPLSNNLMIKVGNGLDFDIATMTMTADERDDNDGSINTRIYEVESTATTISLRTVANAYIKFGSFGLGGGVNLMIPLTTSLKQSAASNNRFAGELAGVTPEEDVLKLLDHRKNTFGLEFIFSAYYTL